jgi:palmitoyltransferase
MPNTRQHKNLRRERKCCGIIQEVKYQARERRVRGNKGQPWVVLKIMIPITIGIMFYAAYVYIGRLCVKMIQRQNGAGGSRGAGSK